MQFLSKLFSTDIAIDLGTANCLVYVRDLEKVVLAEPSVVAIKKSTHEVIAIGNAAKAMVGKCNPNLEAIRPMKEGVIANYEITEQMLRYFISEALRRVKWYKRILHPRVLIAVPSGITNVENRAVKDSAKHAGAGVVAVADEPLAAAVGVGLPVADPEGSMIVDMGGGTTEVAVISLAGIVSNRSVRMGGDTLDSAIMQHIKRVYNLIIGENTAESIKINIGSVYPVKDGETMQVSGLDSVSRVPKTIQVSAKEIRNALQEPITSVLEAVRATLDTCPPELAADLVDRGIMLSGGGALLPGFDKLLAKETGLPVFVAKDPLDAVVKGAGIMLQDSDGNILNTLD